MYEIDFASRQHSASRKFLPSSLFHKYLRPFTALLHLLGYIDHPDHFFWWAKCVSPGQEKSGPTLFLGALKSSNSNFYQTQSSHIASGAPFLNQWKKLHVMQWCQT
jgi:hypothetical protein